MARKPQTNETTETNTEEQNVLVTDEQKGHDVIDPKAEQPQEVDLSNVEEPTEGEQEEQEENTAPASGSSEEPVDEGQQEVQQPAMTEEVAKLGLTAEQLLAITTALKASMVQPTTTMGRATTVTAVKAEDAAYVRGLPTKSAKIRWMDSKGYSKATIAKHLGIIYQHVRNVIATPVKRPMGSDTPMVQGNVISLDPERLKQKASELGMSEEDVKALVQSLVKAA